MGLIYTTYASDPIQSGLPRASGQMKATIKRYVHDEQGATAIEYALIAVFISIVFLAAAQAIGADLNGTFTTVSNALK
jgi:pilus assembly protein Flp/PilA